VELAGGPFITLLLPYWGVAGDRLEGLLLEAAPLERSQSFRQVASSMGRWKQFRPTSVILFANQGRTE